jgi:hypothetical protein
MHGGVVTVRLVQDECGLVRLAGRRSLSGRAKGERLRLSIIQLPGLSVERALRSREATEAIREHQSAPEVTGPTRIVQITGQVAELGWPTTRKLVGMRSLSLGVPHIVPFPWPRWRTLLVVLIVRHHHEAVLTVGRGDDPRGRHVLLLGRIVVVTISDSRRVVGG